MLGESLPDGNFDNQVRGEFDTVLYSRQNEANKSVTLTEVDEAITILLDRHPEIRLGDWYEPDYNFTNLRIENCRIIVDKQNLDNSVNIQQAIEFWANCELVFTKTPLEINNKYVSVGAMRNPNLPNRTVAYYTEFPGKLTFTCTEELANNSKWQNGTGYVSQTLMFGEHDYYIDTFDIRSKGEIDFVFGTATSMGEKDESSGLINKGIITSLADLKVGEVGLLVDINDQITTQHDGRIEIIKKANFEFSVVAYFGSTVAKWTGTSDMVWKVTDGSSLGDDTTPAYSFKNGDTAQFEDEGSGEVKLEGSIAPKEVIVNNSTDSEYTFSGTGKLTGEMKLTKDGEGTLIINTANDYTGDTDVNNGTLVLAEDGAIQGNINLADKAKVHVETRSGSMDCGISGAGTISKGTASVVAITGSIEDFTGDMEVQEGTLNIMNVDETGKLNVADVTIAADGTLGVYKGETSEEANEGTLNIQGGSKLTAGKRARLNADLVMGGGEEAPAVLDVSASGGEGGLYMGSTVTLTPGNVLLSDDDMEALGALGVMGKYDLFNGVDALSLGGDFLSELGLADKWVKAADVFTNPALSAEKEYYLFYSGQNQGGAGGNAGTVYLMKVPEPTSGTLSLLALAALAARRRRK